MLKSFPAVTPDPAITRQVLSEAPELMVDAFTPRHDEFL